MGNSQARYGTDCHSHLWKQYKLYVEMADRISQRRMDTNKFFISVHTFMITLMRLFSRNNYAALILASVRGILFSGLWFFLLKSYRQRSVMATKFRSFDDFPLVLWAEDFMPILNIGRNAAYELIRSVRVG